MNEEREFYLLGQVAHLLGVMPHQIVYQLTTRKVPEPRLRLAGKRIFSKQDIERLAIHLHRALPSGFGAEIGGGQ